MTYVNLENFMTLRSPLLPVAQLSLLFKIRNSSGTHNSSTRSRELIAAFRLLTLTETYLSWPRTTNCDTTHTRQPTLRP